MTRLLMLSVAVCAGCARSPQPVAVGEPVAPQAAVGSDPPPGPDLTRLRYDAQTRTLSLYALPERGARWHVELPGDEPVPADGDYDLPPEAAAHPTRVRVYYALPGRSQSPVVTVREIVDAQSARAAR